MTTAPRPEDAALTVPPAESAVLREKAALACRILAMEGLAEGVLGHVSVRVGDDRMLIRCRGAAESGLLRTSPGEVRTTTFAGQLLGPDEGYAIPNELPLHGETLRTRPEVNAVVHVHPRAVLLCGLAGLPLRPVFGAYNIPATRMAIAGVPVHPRAVLIRTPQLAAEMLDSMGESPVCVLRGHGITVTGSTLEQAVVRAVDLNSLAEVTLAAAGLGGVPDEISAEDLAELPDLGSGFNDDFAWQALAAKAAHQGL
jgi:ribulose-5-phosphate 4-epimerase/fuculose-1-phosphate aldolase